MSDQCKYCSGRGDIKKCESADCDKHETWYAKYLKKELSEKDKRIDRLKFIIAKLVIKHDYDKTLFDLDDCKLIDEAMEVMK